MQFLTSNFRGGGESDDPLTRPSRTVVIMAYPVQDGWRRCSTVQLTLDGGRTICIPNRWSVGQTAIYSPSANRSFRSLVEQVAQPGETAGPVAMLTRKRPRQLDSSAAVKKEERSEFLYISFFAWPPLPTIHR